MLTSLIHIIFQIFTFIVIIDALISFFLPPYNPIRSFLDRVVQPFLNPIRKVLPSIGGFDFSPVVLLLILQLLEYLLVQIL